MNNIHDLKQERDSYIVQVAKAHPDWSLRKVAETVRSAYGECSHEHVRTILQANKMKVNE
jgi:hypothetical protein